MPPGSTLCSGGSRTYQNGTPFCSVTIVVPRLARTARAAAESRPLMRLEGQQQRVERRRARADRRRPRRVTVKLPRSLSTRSPSRRIAARCAPRATTATETPGARERRGEKPADRARADDRDRASRVENLEATGRFELPNGAFAEPCLTTWLRRRSTFVRSG